MKKKLVILIALFSLSTAMFGQLDRSKVPVAQANPEIKINIPESMSFGNGLQVILVENHKLPVVSFQLFTDYPSELEGDKAGLSQVFGEMLGSGTENTPKDKFDAQIDYIGADFYANSKGFYASSLKKHTPQLLGLLKEVIMQPAFQQEDFDRIIAQNLSNLASLPSDASSISSNVSSVVRYGNSHPYGEVVTEETINNITLDDVKAFYKNKFIPNHAYLVIIGDVNRDDVKGMVADYFEAWPKKQQLKQTNYSVPSPKGNQVFFVDKPGAVQSVINITHNVKLKPGDQDEIKLRVLNQILGGGSFSARLLSNLREDKAYTYGCYSNISSDQLIGSFSAGGSFRNDVTDSAIVQILSEINRITLDEVLDKELDLVKKSMTGAFARSLESPRTIARFALNTVRYDLPADYYATYLQKLEKVTKSELLMVASQYLAPNNLNIVVVGNQEIADKLAVFSKDGKVNFRNYYGQVAEQIKQVPAGVTAASVLNTYIMNVMMASNETELKAKMENIKQIETYAKGEIKAYGIKLMQYNAKGANNKTASYVMMKSPQGIAVQQTEWFNGEEGEAAAGGETTVYEGEELAEKMKPNFPVSQVGYMNDEALTVELLGIITLDEAPHYKLKITGKEETTFEYYNVATGMLTKEEIYSTDDKGEEVVVILTHSDYKEQGGLYLSHKLALNSQGVVIDFEKVRVVTNKKAKAKAFSGKFKKIDKVLRAL